MTLRRVRLLLVAVLAVTGSAAFSAPASSAGLELLETSRPATDTVDHRFRTPALGVEPRVRVVLPPGYRNSRRRYPVLYLLHGAIDDYRSMTEKGLVGQVAARRQMILVMPDSGPASGYVNWITPAPDGPRKWRTFHLRQLISWIDRRYRTVESRSARAVAGISMGGGGALRYAARRPDLFSAAASLSGAVDYRDPALRAVTSTAVYGPWESSEIRWRGDNPFDLAINLGALRVALHSADGRPAAGQGPVDPVEAVVYRMSAGLNEELDRLGIRHVWHDYGPGGHSWEMWVPELAETIAWAKRSFARPRGMPRSFSYRSIDRSYGAFGWRVKLRRPNREFSRLNVLGPRRVTVTGSGLARVCSPPRFTRGRAYRVTTHDLSGTRSSRVAADIGRICVRLRLGPAHREDQFTPGAKTSVFAGGARIMVPRRANHSRPAR